MSTTVDTGREDPLNATYYAIEAQGVISGFFTEVSGLGSETAIIEHKVVNAKGVEVVMKIPGRLSWGDVTLKRGITSNKDLWDWRKMVEEGKVKEARKNGSIVAYDQSLTEVARWNFENAWPSKIDGPSPSAEANDVMMEEVTIVHEFIERVS